MDEEEVFLSTMTAISIKTRISVFMFLQEILICSSSQDYAHEKHSSRDTGKTSENDSTERRHGGNEQTEQPKK